MNNLLDGIILNLYKIVSTPSESSGFSELFMIIPFFVIFEICWTTYIFIGLALYKIKRRKEGIRRPYFPSVSCIVTCYSEGREIEKTVISLAEQIYPGKIQILLVIDGALNNTETLEAARNMEIFARDYENRSVLVLPKWQRSGVVSSSNLALNFATGEIIIKADGDSSFDNNMVERATRHFEDETVVAVSGCLRVRNADATLCAALQAIEYFLSIQSSKTALSEFNMVNNISGAFGIFRRKILDVVEGWDAGTAEDLDMTLRIKNYFARSNKRARILFDPESICFTEVPESFSRFFKQRIRWDGDYPFILFKHRHSISPSFLGWADFLGILLSMFTQIVLPAVVLYCVIWLVWKSKLDYAIALLLAIYIFYVLLLFTIYLVSVFSLSERKKGELSRIMLLPLVPLFLFSMKINALVAVLWQFIGKGHRDTSMAPWWVLRKSRF